MHYNKCRVEYWTHAIGGLSENDFICAAKADAPCSKFEKSLQLVQPDRGLSRARNLLENAGIEVVVKNAILSSAMGELPPAECQAEVWVLNDSRPEAGGGNTVSAGDRRRLDVRLW